MTRAVWIILAVNAVWTWLLLDWDKRLRAWQGHRRPVDPCDVCITGASVTAFLNNSRMCAEHQAHWRLVHDLETQVFRNG